MNFADTLLLLQQFEIKLNKFNNMHSFRIAIILFIKRYLIHQEIKHTTTLDEIYNAQKQVNASKIQEDQNKFKEIFNKIRKHIKYNIPDNNSNQINDRLGFDPANIPPRQLICNNDSKLIASIVPMLPPLAPTNLALGYSPNPREIQLCKLAPNLSQLNFYDLHNGITTMFNQIKYKVKLAFEYIVGMNAIPCSIFTDKQS